MSGHYYEDPASFSDNECMLSEAQVHLRDCFRLLWEQHIYWTRMVIMGIVFNLPDLEATTKRLLRNAPDFARLFRRFYGKEIACEFERLIRDHLVIAAELVKAAKDGNTKAAADAEKRWYANADEIVYFLRHINPYWSVKHMRSMWYEHLALTKEEAVAMLSKNYTNSIEIFNQIEKQALMMADAFSNGIISQFGL
ncbi:hypothetical protein [Sporolituus thermophilus]|uniref:Acetylglutamate kinase n=1 Tax=Sporolituus thermophilus DSM 23256 TaxID=1123285 RepID=A0A1G7KZG0_9FIRM|nr:hypothetical protein [Sporolituus thermophilus]SDF42129.1 hypothetical protein SAMN05660235_01519 [Sporolituus thermophilus DSM 23256]